MIIPGKKEHWEQIREIYIEGIETDLATFEQPCNVTSYEKWMDGKVNDAVFVYMQEHLVGGWASLSSVNDRCVYAGVAEVSVYVRLAKNGQGIGRQLLQALIDFAENNDIWTLQAGIFPDNLPSIRIHENLGFRKVGRREKLGKLKGEWKDVLLYERRSETLL